MDSGIIRKHRGKKPAAVGYCKMEEINVDTEMSFLNCFSAAIWRKVWCERFMQRLNTIINDFKTQI